MDLVYNKQNDLIQRYKEVAESENPSIEDASYYRREINRQYHILNHMLRAQFNNAGRAVTTVIGTGIGLMFFAAHRPIYVKNCWKIQLRNFVGFVGGGSVLGYAWGRRFHSKRLDATKNNIALREYRAIHDPIIKEYEEILESKLARKH